MACESIVMSKTFYAKFCTVYSVICMVYRVICCVNVISMFMCVNCTNSINNSYCIVLLIHIACPL